MVQDFSAVAILASVASADILASVALVASADRSALMVLLALALGLAQDFRS